MNCKIWCRIVLWYNWEKKDEEKVMIKLLFMGIFDFLVMVLKGILVDGKYDVLVVVM